MARLIVESGGERREYPIAGSLVIGRLRSNQVFIDDNKLSREHARIQYDGRVFILQDLGSKNGTFLNGQRLEQPTALRPNDVIKVGEMGFRFALDSGDPAPPPELAPARSNKAADEAERAHVASRLAEGQAAKRKAEGVPTGPDAGTVMVYYLVLAGVLVGGTFIARILFTWALKVVVPQ